MASFVTLSDVEPIPLERFDIVSLCRSDTNLPKIIASHIEETLVYRAPSLPIEEMQMSNRD